jgi:hypothetical protein
MEETRHSASKPAMKGNELLPGNFLPFPQGEDGREDRGGRMPHHPQMNVVKIEGVRRPPVDQGGLEEGSLLLPADERGLGLSPLLFGHRRENMGQRLLGPAEGHSQPVEKTELGPFHHIFGKIGKFQIDEVFGKRLGDFHDSSQSRYSLFVIRYSLPAPAKLMTGTSVS